MTVAFTSQLNRLVSYGYVIFPRIKIYLDHSLYVNKSDIYAAFSRI